MSFDPDLTACAALVQKGDPDRFAATMASPVAARRVLFPLYAFNVEVSRAPWVTQEPMIAEMRLQWWRDALEEIGSGKPVRRHEVVTPLAAILDSTAAETLDKLVQARRWDIYRDAFEDQAHFEAYLDATAAGLMWVAARALGAGEFSEDTVRRLGAATGLARFFQAVPELESRGRIPLIDGRPEAIAKLARSGWINASGGMALRRCVVKPARPALFEAWQTAPLLKLAEKHPRRVANGTLRLNPLRRSLRLWSTTLL